MALWATIGAALLPGSPTVAARVDADRSVQRAAADESCALTQGDPGRMPADEPRLRDSQSFGEWVQNRFAPSATIEPQPTGAPVPETVAPTARLESVQFPQRVIPLRL